MLSFHESTHCRHWIVPDPDQACNALDRAAFQPAEVLAIKVNYINVLMALGRQMRLRQTVTATAMTYFWRFLPQKVLYA